MKLLDLALTLLRQRVQLPVLLSLLKVLALTQSPFWLVLLVLKPPTETLQAAPRLDCTLTHLMLTFKELQTHQLLSINCCHNQSTCCCAWNHSTCNLSGHIAHSQVRRNLEECSMDWWCFQ